jgi:uncharacterized protein (DUF433 family)
VGVTINYNQLKKKQNLITVKLEYAHSDPKILFGKPIVRGTRLSVEFLLGLFSEGWTEQQVLDSYPNLNTQSIQAIFVFATECLTGIIERDQIRQRPLPS